ncbi:hypothetical protein CCACVL1_10609 [Corchorus capsularis]|uniref:Uncharacterized protein n=1 Tax=Corchorus capsularis TaxID=210143 RepID=A0A1R3IQJ3_COCAP|nr:hypothetical protein CCACVL1_10609 [Corchorus capsularis]
MAFSKKRKRLKTLDTSMRRLRSDMEEISKEQKKIKEGQRQVREKFEAIEFECDELRKETNLIMQQSVSTQFRLAFMFQILKARENQEFDKAAQLTCALRKSQIASRVIGNNQVAEEYQLQTNQLPCLTSSYLLLAGRKLSSRGTRTSLHKFDMITGISVRKEGKGEKEKGFLSTKDIIINVTLDDKQTQTL